MKLFISLLSLFLLSNMASAQNHFIPGKEYTFSAPSHSGDSMIMWRLTYDSLGNASISTSVYPYLADPKLYIVNESSKTKFTSTDSSSALMPVLLAEVDTISGLNTYVFNMEFPNSNGKRYADSIPVYVLIPGEAQRENCCIPSFSPGQDYEFNFSMKSLLSNCAPCGDPKFLLPYLNDPNSSKAIVTSGVLVIKAKSIRTQQMP